MPDEVNHLPDEEIKRDEALLDVLSKTSNHFSGNMGRSIVRMCRKYIAEYKRSRELIDGLNKIHCLILEAVKELNKTTESLPGKLDKAIKELIDG